MTVRIDYIEPIGVDSFDLKIVHSFNEKAHAINSMNFEFEYEEAERAGATDYIELLDTLQGKWADVQRARSRVIEYGEAIKHQAQKFTVKKQEAERLNEQLNELFNEAIDFINKTDVYGS